jgi:hypothetical protein
MTLGHDISYCPDDFCLRLQCLTKGGLSSHNFKHASLPDFTIQSKQKKNREDRK